VVVYAWNNGSKHCKGGVSFFPRFLYLGFYHVRGEGVVLFILASVVLSIWGRGFSEKFVGCDRSFLFLISFDGFAGVGLGSGAN